MTSPNIPQPIEIPAHAVAAVGEDIGRTAVPRLLGLSLEELGIAPLNVAVPKVPEVDDGKKVRTGPVDSTLLLPEGTPLHTTKTYDELAEDIAKKRAISHAKKFGAPREPVSGPKIGDSIQAE